MKLRNQILLCPVLGSILAVSDLLSLSETTHALDLVVPVLVFLATSIIVFPRPEWSLPSLTFRVVFKRSILLWLQIGLWQGLLITTYVWIFRPEFRLRAEPQETAAESVGRALMDSINRMPLAHLFSSILASCILALVLAVFGLILLNTVRHFSKGTSSAA